ncbi:hypothetical protein K470DRAFT_139809 [Piedraia hortae CBS 480.64]|uniref:BZIP domain-containing protein n=1 Tax=Piedraia hortae CBS 480.64 TaxID=1314780 RepID=A0A6A7C6K9_9PEZI|nr:hypothetical protein K470DRAFT_139809 [Piedraia hortae CBS 480.64]
MQRGNVAGMPLYMEKIESPTPTGPLASQYERPIKRKRSETPAGKKPQVLPSLASVIDPKLIEQSHGRCTLEQGRPGITQGCAVSISPSPSQGSRCEAGPASDQQYMSMSMDKAESRKAQNRLNQQRFRMRQKQKIEQLEAELREERRLSQLLRSQLDIYWRLLKQEDMEKLVGPSIPCPVALEP